MAAKSVPLLCSFMPSPIPLTTLAVVLLLLLLLLFLLLLLLPLQTLCPLVRVHWAKPLAPLSPCHLVSTSKGRDIVEKGRHCCMASHTLIVCVHHSLAKRPRCVSFLCPVDGKWGLLTSQQVPQSCGLSTHLGKWYRGKPVEAVPSSTYMEFP